MEINSGRQSRLQNMTGESRMAEPFRTEIFIAPGVPVVRGNTPKPLSMQGYSPGTERSQMTQSPVQSTASVPGFPMEAPVAPPLPEESAGERNNTVGAVESSPVSHASGSDLSSKAASEFVWLFEYGLEMNASLLNSPERLNGLALLYGLAVLKGYRIVFDAVEPRSKQVVANIRSDNNPQAVVWGVLYRIPRRLTERRSDQPSILDMLHLTAQFEVVEAIVHDAHRGRDIKCITYIASAASREQFHVLPKERQVIDTAYIQRLLVYARQQKLPDEYLDELAQFSSASPEHSVPQSEVVLTSVKIGTTGAPKAQARTRGLAVDAQPNEVRLPVEQNTEPLPALTGKAGIVSPKHSAHRDTQPLTSSRWLMAFALYVVLLFLLVLTLSILQALGFWSDIFTASFAPLGAPWFVLVYGLLGGCVSGIITIGRRRSTSPPGFVVITWFTRPFIGAVLAALAYLALSSGFFILTSNTEQRYALFSLLGAFAGLCERWIFFGRA